MALSNPNSQSDYKILKFDFSLVDVSAVIFSVKGFIYYLSVGYGSNK